jgi:hypothetical protein
MLIGMTVLRNHARSRSRKRARELGFPGSDPCERSRLSDVWSALDLSAPLTKDKCAGSDVAENGQIDYRQKGGPL